MMGLANTRSTTLRLFSLHLIASFFSAALILTVVYLGAMRLLESQTAAVVQADLQGLAGEYQEGGQFALRRAIARRMTARDNADSIYLYASQTGAPFAGNLSQWPEVEPDGRWRLVKLVRTDIDRKALAGGQAFVLPGGARLFVGRDLRKEWQFRKILLIASATLLFFFLISGTLGGFAISRTVLRRVNELSGAAERIAAGALSERAVVTGANDEFDRLANSINHMLEQNESLIEELRTVTDSLAHDLRTPLTRLRSHIEAIAAHNACSGEEIEAALTEADYIQSVFSALIDIARADAGLAKNQFETIDLATIIRDAGDLYRPLAEEKSQTIIVRAAAPVRVCGHAQFLARAAANLLDNAVKYAPSGSEITATARRDNHGAWLAVCDQGPGLSDADWPLATRRFGRLDAGPGASGVGLGLSLVASIATMHAATLHHLPQPQGLCVALLFPDRAPES